MIADCFMKMMLVAQREKLEKYIDQERAREEYEYCYAWYTIVKRFQRLNSLVNKYKKTVYEKIDIQTTPVEFIVPVKVEMEKLEQSLHDQMDMQLFQRLEDKLNHAIENFKQTTVPGTKSDDDDNEQVFFLVDCEEVVKKSGKKYSFPTGAIRCYLRRVSDSKMVVGTMQFDDYFYVDLSRKELQKDCKKTINCIGLFHSLYGYNKDPIQTLTKCILKTKTQTRQLVKTLAAKHPEANFYKSKIDVLSKFLAHFDISGAQAIKVLASMFLIQA